jgi:hypothetical protein
LLQFKREIAYASSVKVVAGTQYFLDLLIIALGIAHQAKSVVSAGPAMSGQK